MSPIPDEAAEAQRSSVPWVGQGAAGGARGQARVIVIDPSLFHSYPLPAFAAFLLMASLLDFQRALALFVLTCVGLTVLAHSLLKRLLGPRLLRCVEPLGHYRLGLWFER